MFQAPREPSSIFTVFGNSFRLYKDIVLKVLPWTILIAIFECISRAHSVVSDNMANGVDYSFHMPVLSIIMTILGTILYGCVVYQLWQTMDQKSANLSEVFSKGILRGIIGTISYAIFAAIYGLIIFVVFWLLHFIPVVGELLAFAIIIVSAVFIVTSLISWIPSIIDGENPWSAFKNSFALIKGQWWATFLLLILVCVALFIAYSIIGLIFGRGVEMPDVTHMTTMNYIGIVVSSIIIVPWVWSVWVLQTRNLKLYRNHEHS